MRTVPQRYVGSFGYQGYRVAKSTWHTPDIWDPEDEEFTVTANRIYAVPYFVGKKFCVDNIGIYVTTPVSNGLVRIGIYANKPGFCGPGRLLCDAGEIKVDRGGTHHRPVLQYLNENKIYWLAFVSSCACEVKGIGVSYVGSTTYTGGEMLGFHFADKAPTVLGTGPRMASHIYSDYSFGALPSDFPTYTAYGTHNITSTQAPKIFIRQKSKRIIERIQTNESLVFVEPPRESFEEGNYLYGAEYTSTYVKLHKIRKVDFCSEKYLELNNGEEYVARGVPDGKGNGWFFTTAVMIGMGQYPMRIIKVRLSDMTRLGYTQLAWNPWYYCRAAFRDQAQGSDHIIFISDDDGSTSIGRYNCSKMILEKSATLTQDIPMQSVVDWPRRKLYICHYGEPGEITQFDLATFKLEKVCTLDTGDCKPQAITLCNDFLYVSGDTQYSGSTYRGILVRISLPAFSRDAKLDLDYADTSLYRAFNDGTWGWFFNDETNKPGVTKFRLNDFAWIGQNSCDYDDRFSYGFPPNLTEKVVYSHPCDGDMISSGVQTVKYDINFKDTSEPTLQAFIHLGPESSYGYLSKFEWISEATMGLTPNSTYEGP